MNKKKIHNLIIIGSGPAGYTACIYASRANLNPVLITGKEIGGQLMNTDKIENWPGEHMLITGQKLMYKMHKQVLKLPCQVITDVIQKVKFLNYPFCMKGEKKSYFSRSVIIATGSSPKRLNISSEKKFQNKGVSSCALCDGFFYKKKKVAVIGGGNTAVEEAIFLSNICNVVYLIHRRDIFKAEKILINRLLKLVKKKKIILYKNYYVHKILGNENEVIGIKICKKNHKKKYCTIKVNGVFIAIGHNPNSDIFKNQILMKNKYIKIFKNNEYCTSTSVPGIFVSGDVADPIYKQAITSAASGCMAAIDAEKYIRQIKKNI